MKGMKKRNNTNYYIKNEEILPYIYQYRETGKIPEELGKILLTIAENYTNKGSFRSYTWRDDMVSEAVLTCIKYIHNFDPIRQKKPNPFAYFTMIIHRSFLTYIKKQKKHSKIKNELYNSFNNDDFEEYFFDKIKGINYEKLKEK